MAKILGTVARGLIAPIIHDGDNIVEIATKTLLHASEQANFEIRDKDVLAITESVVARAQGNYASIEDITQDIVKKFTDSTLGLVFPILSRNRFSLCLEGIARTGKKLVLVLSYPADEVGNHLVDPDIFEDSNVNPWVDSFLIDDFRKKFGAHAHKFTGIDYVAFYDLILKKYNSQSFILLSNNAKDVLKYTDSVLVCDIHTRKKTKKMLLKNGAKTVLGLDDILTESPTGKGFNSKYGLLGSNKASDTSLKLFPENPLPIVLSIQEQVLKKTGKQIEVMVYGDGAFRDPIGKIWELADPVVSPAYTPGLVGTPSEVKLKYLADNDFKHFSPEEQKRAIAEYIATHEKKSDSDVASRESVGTTPRRLIDLLGSFSDLVSGSGDKGTPFIYIQGYFDKYVG